MPIDPTHDGAAEARAATYEAVLDVEPHLAERLEAYMRGRHVPAIFATGCFHDVRFERAGVTRFRTLYRAATRADLDRYLAQHAPGLRADFLAHFPTGISVTRETWDELETWG
jgi:hypothetical protein